MKTVATKQLIAYKHWERRGHPLGDDWTDWFWAEHLLHLASNLEVALLVAEHPYLWECLPPRDGSGFPSGLDPRDFFTFAQAKVWVEEFEAILRKYGIAIEHGSILEDVWLEVAEMEARRTGASSFDLKKDMRDAQRRALGLLDIARRVARVEAIGRLNPLVGHLQLLSKCDFAQNVRSTGGWGRQLLQEQANKVFELLVGLVISELSSDVVLEVAEGQKAKKRNPDVVGTITGRKWGFACKVLCTTPSANLVKTAAKAIKQNLEKGCEQLAESKVEKGLVIINLKNVLAHDDFWNVIERDEAEEIIYSALPSEQIAVRKMDVFVDALAEALRLELGPDDVAAIFSDECLIPSVLMVMQTALVVVKSGKPIPTTLGRLARIPIENMIEAGDLQVIEMINRVFGHRPAK